jgi:ParB-like chromosome segregation protein Spo0J
MEEQAEKRATAGGVPVFCAYDEIVPIAGVKPNPRNPNKHPEGQVKVLASIIRGTGWRAAITVSTRSGFIVKGHGRLMAAISAGLSEVPVEYQGFSSDEEELAALLADNKVAELSEIDQSAAADIIGSIAGDGMFEKLTGFSDDEITDILGGVDGGQDERKPKMESDFKYQEQFGVIVVCENEMHQEEVYERLHAEGLTVKVVKV